ncbi:hypothetical protein BGZ83_002657 [Gryganskiella cystojenkinii]|nr:hypothetical protein BGZ83_002657 [Gryganskiella cystojenkinii]
MTTSSFTSSSFPPVKPNQIKPCVAKNNGQGCSRGFFREKCPKCTNGSLTCQMCQLQRKKNPNASSSSLLLNTTANIPITTTVIAVQEHQQLSSSSSSVSSISSTSETTATFPIVPSVLSQAHQSSPPGVTVKTVSISYQLPLPTGHPQRSLVSDTPTTPVVPSKDIKLSIITLPSSLSSSSSPPISPTTERAVAALNTAVTSSSPSSPQVLTISTVGLDTRIHPHVSKSYPSSPLYGSGNPLFGLPSASISSSCIFCFNGRQACDDCFGLGYVQRICQDCLRDHHQGRNQNSQSNLLQRRGSSGGDPQHVRHKSLPSVPTGGMNAAWSQIGTKIKKQLFPQQQQPQQQQHQQQQHDRRSSLSESAVDQMNLSSSSSYNNPIMSSPLTSPTSSSARARIFQGLRRTQSSRNPSNGSSSSASELSSSSMTSGGSLSQTSSSTLGDGGGRGLGRIWNLRRQPPPLRSKSMVSLGMTAPMLGPLHEEEIPIHDDDEDDGEGDATTEASTVAIGISGNRLRDQDTNQDAYKKSFRAAVLRALKRPLFHINNREPLSNNSNSEHEGTSRPQRTPHRRHWSLASLSVVSLPSTVHAA